MPSGAPSSAADFPQLVLHGEQRAQDIGVERAGVGLRGDVGDVAHLAVAAGVVHRDVQAAELPGDGATRLGSRGLQFRQQASA